MGVVPLGCVAVAIAPGFCRGDLPCSGPAAPTAQIALVAPAHRSVPTGPTAPEARPVHHWESKGLDYPSASTFPCRPKQGQRPGLDKAGQAGRVEAAWAINRRWA
eukprot:23666-Alexandrium_andersonii.AAC.1